MAAGLLLHLLLINNLFGAGTQLLCVIRVPVESVSPQPSRTVGVPGDLAAASSLCPKIKEVKSLNPNSLQPPLFNLEGNPNLPVLFAAPMKGGVPN